MTTTTEERLKAHRETQLRLFKMKSHTPFPGIPNLCAGIDLSYDTKQNRGFAAIVLIDYATRTLVDWVHASEKIDFPYIPGYLSFRELPVIQKAWEKLSTKPDLLFFDGNGTIHPLQTGIAVHGGIEFDTPSIGIAKSHLLGTYDLPGEFIGDASELFYEKECLGAVMRSKPGARPIYVSPGHRMTQEDAIRLTQHFLDGKARVPLPTRLADKKSRSAMTKP